MRIGIIGAGALGSVIGGTLAVMAIYLLANAAYFYVLPAQEVIAYCQVGMRASVDLFALHLIGYDKLKNYYGAWEEWGNRDDLPISKK